MRVVALAEVLEQGQKVTAVALDYQEVIGAEAVSTEMFSVPGRSIIRCYVNDSGRKGDVQLTGHVVMLDLAIDPVPGNNVGSTLLHANQLNARLPIYLSVIQKVNIVTKAGGTFPPGVFPNTEEHNLEIDEVFSAHTYHNPVDGTTLNYRLYTPKKIAGPVPLVVFLHGIGERGSNNITQLAANRGPLEWTEAGAQAEHPCMVLAPQCPADTMWAINVGTETKPAYQSSYGLRNVRAIIDELMHRYEIDTTRIYGTGLSMGSMGTLMLAMENPRLYAGIIAVCGASRYSDSMVAAIAHKPIWAFVAADDAPFLIERMRTLVGQLQRLGGVVTQQTGSRAWNGFLRGEAANDQARDHLVWAESEGANILYSEYIPGTVLPSGHMTWMQVYSTEVIRTWLFAQRLPATR